MHIFILEIFKSPPIFMHRSIFFFFFFFFLLYFFFYLGIIKQSIYMRILLQDMIIHQYICAFFLFRHYQAINIYDILLQDMIIHQYIQKMSYLSPPWHHQKINIRFNISKHHSTF
jgi:hypothetical protein